MAPHSSIEEITADDVVRLIGNFAHFVKRADAAARREQSKLGTELGSLAPDSVEYALAVCALASEEFLSQKEQFGQLVRLIDEIRPPKTGGRMGRQKPPEQFGDKWPHERLQHSNWTQFVTTPRQGVRDPEDESRLLRGPGLGWSKQYESNIFRGFEEIEKWAKRENPGATEADVTARVDATLAGAGVKVVETIGWKVTPGSNFEGPQATLALDALAAGEVTSDDVQERGADALTNPRPKGQRKQTDIVAKAIALVRKMTAREYQDFETQLNALRRSP